jgi:heme-degrading monooxygenase HmoA
MHAAIRRYKAKPGSASELARRAQEGFVPLVSGLPGFIAYYGLAVDNDVVTVSIFEDQAGEEESTRRAAEWVKHNLAEFLEGSPEVIAGHVDWHSWG